MLILDLLIDGAIIGFIIIMMEGEFPGWGPMVGCALAIGLASGIATALLPDEISLLGLLAGAAVGGYIISWLCEVPLRRGMKAAGIYLGVRIIVSIALAALMNG